VSLTSLLPARPCRASGRVAGCGVKQGGYGPARYLPLPLPLHYLSHSPYLSCCLLPVVLLCCAVVLVLLPVVVALSVTPVAPCPCLSHHHRHVTSVGAAHVSPHTRIHQWTMGGRVGSSRDREAGGVVSYLVNRLGCQCLTTPRSEGVRSLNFFLRR